MVTGIIDRERVGGEKRATEKLGSGLGRLGLGLALVVTSGQIAAGQVSQCNDYEVEHEFTWTVAARPGNGVLELTAKRFCHAWVIDRPRGGAECRDVEVVPVGQPAGWNSYGKDHLGPNATVRTSRTSSGSTQATVEEDVYLINSADPVMAAVLQIDNASASCNSTADANSRIEIDAYTLGDTTVSGKIRSWGEACAVLPDGWRSAWAYAFSMSAVEARGGKENGKGRIRWGKRIRTVTSGSAEARIVRQVDPIEYRATNLVTGEVIEGTLLSIYLDIDPSQIQVGGLFWENDLLITDVMDGEFVLDLSSPYLAPGQARTLRFKLENGFVTASSSSGMYAGMAPAIGAQVPLVLPVPNVVEFDYELPIFNNGDDYEVELTFGGGGEADEALASTDCPADLDGDGVVGSADLAFVLGQWGAHCDDPSIPCPGDVDGDGIVSAADLASLLGSWGPCPADSGGPGDDGPGGGDDGATD